MNIPAHAILGQLQDIQARLEMPGADPAKHMAEIKQNLNTAKEHAISLTDNAHSTTFVAVSSSGYFGKGSTADEAVANLCAAGRYKPVTRGFKIPGFLYVVVGASPKNVEFRDGTIYRPAYAAEARTMRVDNMRSLL